MRYSQEPIDPHAVGEPVEVGHLLVGRTPLEVGEVYEEVSNHLFTAAYPSMRSTYRLPPFSNRPIAIASSAWLANV